MQSVDAAEVEAFVVWMRQSGRSPKTTLNALGLLHSIFDYAIKRGWMESTSSPASAGGPTSA